MAKPTTQTLTYRETKILRDVDIVDDGMYITLAIPFVIAATVLNLYKIILISMPNVGAEGQVSEYAMESGFIAVSSAQK